MNWRSKWTFWATVAAVLALVSLPSIEWLAALDDYRRFLSGWELAPLKPSSTSFTPRDSGGVEPPLIAIEFRHKDQRAKSVELVGDFNAWKPGLLRMIQSGGVWTLSVPVAAGRHKYLFLVDGEPTVDAHAPTADGPQGRRVSVRTVK